MGKNPNTLVIGGGDYFGAGSLSGVDKGKLMLEVLYDMEMKVSAIGNHEFDEGVGSALKLFSESRHKIQWLCSNLTLKQKKNKVIAAKYGLDIKDIEIHQEVIITVKGRKIGLFAMLDKNMKRKMSEQNKIDFVEVFELDDEIKEIS